MFPLVKTYENVGHAFIYKILIRREAASAAEPDITIRVAIWSAVRGAGARMREKEGESARLRERKSFIPFLRRYCE